MIWPDCFSFQWFLTSSFHLCPQLCIGNQRGEAVHGHTYASSADMYGVRDGDWWWKMAFSESRDHHLIWSASTATRRDYQITPLGASSWDPIVHHSNIAWRDHYDIQRNFGDIYRDKLRASMNIESFESLKSIFPVTWNLAPSRQRHRHEYQIELLLVDFNENTIGNRFHIISIVFPQRWILKQISSSVDRKVSYPAGHMDVNLHIRWSILP